MSNFDDRPDYSNRPPPPPPPPRIIGKPRPSPLGTSMRLKGSEIGDLDKDQVIKACKAMYPEEFV